MPPKINLWSREAEVLLADAVESRPILWDSTLQDYRRTDLKERLWEDVAALLGSPFTVDMVKKRFANMKGTFADNERRVKDSKRSGSGADSVFQPTWHLYGRLVFLRKALVSAPSSSNISSVSLESDQENTISHIGASLPIIYNEASQIFQLMQDTEASTCETINADASQTFQVIQDLHPSTSQSINSEDSLALSSPIGSPRLITLQPLPPSRPASAPPSSSNNSTESNKRTSDSELFAKRGAAKKKPTTSNLEATINAIKHIVAQPVVLPETPKQDEVDLFLGYIGTKLRAMDSATRKETEKEIMQVLFAKM